MTYENKPQQNRPQEKPAMPAQTKPGKNRETNDDPKNPEGQHFKDKSDKKSGECC